MVQRSLKTYFQSKNIQPDVGWTGGNRNPNLGRNFYFSQVILIKNPEDTYNNHFKCLLVKKKVS